MMVVVTFVSLMVHVFTIGYMADDPGYQRFFATSRSSPLDADAGDANNFLQLFFAGRRWAWCPTLIGFWYTRESAIYATSRLPREPVGDFGFIWNRPGAGPVRRARLWFCF
jgi:NADH-quinone oxidoreductase subunit L